MPFRHIARRRRYRSRLSRRRTHTRGRTSGGRISRKIVAKLNKVYEDAVVDRPPKHILWSDNGVTGGNASPFAATNLTAAAPNIMWLNPIARVGTATNSTVQTRIADECFIKRICLKIFTRIGTAVAGDVMIKWMLIYQTNVQGVALTAANFGADYFGSATPGMNSIPNWNNADPSKRYDILKKGQLFIKETVSGNTQYHNWTIDWRVPKAKKASYALGATATIASLDTGAFYLYMYTTNTFGAGVTGVTSLIEGNTWFRDQV